MLNLYKYAGATAKIKGMNGKLLDKTDYEHLRSLKSVPDILEYLKTKETYKRLLSDLAPHEYHRGQIEKRISLSAYNDFVEIFKFVNGGTRSFFNIYFIYLEIKVLKNIIRCIFDTGDVIPDLMVYHDFFKTHSSLGIEQLSKSKTLDELVSKLKDTPYYKVLSTVDLNEKSLFELEMKLDIYYYNEVCRIIDKKIDKSEKTIVSEVFKSEIDLVNLMWIYRFKKFYNTDKNFIYSYLAPEGLHLKKDKIVRLVETNSVEEFLELAMKITPYKGLFDDLGKDTLEKNFYEELTRINNKLVKKYPFSIAELLWHMNMRNIEILNVITIIEGIRYNLSPSQIDVLLLVPNMNGGVKIDS